MYQDLIFARIPGLHVWKTYVAAVYLLLELSYGHADCTLFCFFYRSLGLKREPMLVFLVLFSTAFKSAITEPLPHLSL